MKLLKLFTLLVGFGSLNAVAQIKVKPWVMNEGSEGVITQNLSIHGDPNAYKFAKIPSANDGGWKAAPIDAQGNVSMDRGSVIKCLEEIDFTYFQTTVTIPANTNVSDFKVSYDNADDGARIYFFNSKFPNGTFDANSDLVGKHANFASTNLKDKVVAGENRIVIVQFDDCADANSIHGIRVTVNGKEIVAAVAPQVATGPNIAKGKTCRSSSVNFGGAASRAVDGNTNGEYGKNSTTHSQDENNPWWEVDLGAYYDVTKIVIWNRTDDCCWNRLSGFYVMGSDQAITANSTDSQYQYKSGGAYSFTSGSQTNMTLDGNKRCRYIRIFIPGNIKILSLAEVEVFGQMSQKQSATSASTTPTKVVATSLPDKFKVHAFSVNEGKKEQDDYWFALKNNNTRGSILSTAKLVDGAKWMEIERVDLPNNAIAFKVVNAGSDMYLVARDNKEVHVEKVNGNNLPDGAKFKTISPLTSAKGANENNYRSFESVKFPNHFLRHAGYILFVNTNNNTELFKQDASWLIQKM